jgi:hypothetical protein
MNRISGYGRMMAGGALRDSRPCYDEGSSQKRQERDLRRCIDFNVEEYISIALTGKVKIIEAKLVAIELGYMINSCAYNNGATIEERAVNREIGMRLAKHLANIFFDCDDEAKAFTDGLSDYVVHDEMLEKGYYFRKCEHSKSYRPVQVSVVSGWGKTFSHEEMIKVFEVNEQKVEETIKAAIASLDDDVVSAKLGEFMKKFSFIRDTMNYDVLGDIQLIMEIQNRRYA